MPRRTSSTNSAADSRPALSVPASKRSASVAGRPDDDVEGGLCPRGTSLNLTLVFGSPKGYASEARLRAIQMPRLGKTSSRSAQDRPQRTSRAKRRAPSPSSGKLPSQELPQADRLDEIRLLVSLIEANPNDLDDTRRTFRHFDYHQWAACTLGLLRREHKSLRLTELGARLLETVEMSCDEAHVFYDAIAGTASLAPFQRFLLLDETPSFSKLCSIAIRRYGVSRSTAVRRVRTLLAWHKQLHMMTGGQPVDARSAPRVDSLAEIVTAWPPFERFPRNEPPHHYVEQAVVGDLKSADNSLIITGYTSLGYLLAFLAELGDTPGTIRVAFGVEPALETVEGIERRTGPVSIADAMRDYWLGRGISILSSRAVLRALALLKDGRLKIRVSPRRINRIHAKIYVTPHVATLGSSNFSRGGMRELTEINARFIKDEEPARYAETVAFAEGCWSLAADFQSGFRDLLMALVKHVHWEEALARAAAALLEGAWAFDREFGEDLVTRLWPSQIQGIKQALWLLENVGMAVVADATGSGKTRMGAGLLRVVDERFRTSGHLGECSPRDAVVVSPPAVVEQWKDELVECGLNLDVYSQGRLSHPRASDQRRIRSALRRASTLVVDEAHNYLNTRSRRTTILCTSLADRGVFFTATPVNRDGYDLLAIVELLGADNLDEKALRVLQEKLWTGAKNHVALSDADHMELRGMVQQFMVRRTKKMLNDMVDREPDAYRNAQGLRCRYPRRETKVYRLSEPEGDRKLAQEIRETAAKLRGILRLQNPIVLRVTQRARGITEHEYCALRVRGAAALASHDVMAMLRSSRAALIEHLHGTALASQQFMLPVDFKTKKSGDQIGELEKLCDTEPPSQPLAKHLPRWLTRSREYAKAVAEELAAYRSISALCSRISPTREAEKVAHLLRLAEQHKLVLAFDSRPITLHVLREQFHTTARLDIILATGDPKTSAGRRAICRRFALGSRGRSGIALCSDVLSEGINLQQGEAIVHLDMPSVIRKAEQRIGRIDRMDSPHQVIKVWWPKDAPEFALRTDEVFIERHQFNSRLLGGNFDLPKELAPEGEIIQPQEFARTLEFSENREFEDAFAPVRCLVSGSTAIVRPRVYDQLRTSKARVVAYVASVESARPFLFAAIGLRETRMPRWVFLTEGQTPATSLDKVAQCLRQHLTDASSIPFGRAAQEQLDTHLAALGHQERHLLPPRKRRALELFDDILAIYRAAGRAERNHRRIKLIDDVLVRVKNSDTSHYYDPDTLATVILDVLRPRLTAQLENRTRTRQRPFLLMDLKPSLIHDPLTNTQLEYICARTISTRPICDRVLAAIVGVSSPSS